MAAQFEQMRFNLCVPPDPANTATRFKLKPTPIVLQKLSSSGQDVKKEYTLEARMELATRLARRDLETTLLLKDTTFPCSSQLPSAVQNPPSSPTAHKPTKETTKVTKPVLGHTKQPHVSFNIPHKSEVTSITRKGDEVSETAEINRVSNEILKLKRDLTQTLYKLLNTLSNQRIYDFEATTKVNGRFDDEDTELQRNLHRAEEQTCRNSRMIYHLEQKIKETQRDVIKSFKGSTTKRLQHLRQLAVLYRTSIRTLNTLVNTSLPTQTYTNRIKIVHQLSSVSNQLLLLSEESQITTSSDDEEINKILIQMEQNSTKSIIEKPQREGLEDQSVKMSTIKKRGPTTKSKGVMLHPSLLSKKKRPSAGSSVKFGKLPHYTKQTFVSTIRRSPQKKFHRRSAAPKSPPTLLSSSPPHPPSHPPAAPHLSPLPPSLNVIPKGNFDDQRKLKDLFIRYEVDSRLTQQVSHLNEVQKDTRNKLEALEDQLEKLKEEKAKGIEPKVAVKGDKVSASSDENQDNESSTSLDEVETLEMLQRDPAVKEMLQRLEEIENEKSQIKGRWQTITYTDVLHPPLLTSCPVTSKIKKDTLSILTNTNPSLSLSSLSLSSSTTTLSCQEQQNLHQNNQQPFVPSEQNMEKWNKIESISNELFERALKEVINEIDETLSICANDLFDAEFHKP